MSLSDYQQPWVCWRDEHQRDVHFPYQQAPRVGHRPHQAPAGRAEAFALLVRALSLCECLCLVFFESVYFCLSVGRSKLTEVLVVEQQAADEKEDERAAERKRKRADNVQKAVEAAAALPVEEKKKKRKKH